MTRGHPDQSEPLASTSYSAPEILLPCVLAADLGLQHPVIDRQRCVDPAKALSLRERASSTPRSPPPFQCFPSWWG